MNETLEKQRVIELLEARVSQLSEEYADRVHDWDWLLSREAGENLAVRRELLEIKGILLD